MSLKIDKRTLQIAVEYNEDAQKYQKLKDHLAEANHELKELKDEKKALRKPKKNDTQAWQEYERKLKDVNDRMEQQRVVVDKAAKAVDEQKKEMGIKALTLRDLNNELKQYNLILSNLQPGTKQFNETKQHIDEVKVRISELRNKTVLMAEETGSSLKRFLEGFNRWGFAITNALSIGDRIFSFGRKIYDWLDPMAQIAQEAEGIEIAFQRIDKPGMLENLRKQTRGMIDDVELMKQAVKFDDFNLPVEQLGTYLAYAQQKSKDTGESMEFLVNSIVTGLGRLRRSLLPSLPSPAQTLRRFSSPLLQICQISIIFASENRKKEVTMVLLLTLFFMWRWCKWLQKLEETPNEELGRFNRWAKRELFDGDDYHYPPFY